MKTGVKIILGIACFFLLAGNSFSQAILDRKFLTGDMPDVIEFNYKSESKVWWSRIAQCQLRYNFEKLKENGLYRISPGESSLLEQKIMQSLEISIQNKANIVVFPELILAFEDATRKKIVEILLQKAKQHELIIICGSFYDSERKNISVIITPDGVLNGDKIRPSRIETNPLNGYGMKTGEKIAYLKTKYGNIIVVTCVDLISDDVQYIIRKMSNLGILDICVNINYNPASWEFMREASAIVKRHPLFFMITNSANPKDNTDDNGHSYGNTSIFASIQKENSEYIMPDELSPFLICQNSDKSIKKSCKRHPAYETLIANIPPDKEGILLYDLNLRLIRTPDETNAPDQGYPTVRNIQTILIQPENRRW
jgi:predicted amidohydrolase